MVSPQRHERVYELFLKARDLDGAACSGAIAVLHTAGAFFLMAFVIAHVYLTTTGRTPTSNLEAMITGYEELEEDVTETETETEVETES